MSKNRLLPNLEDTDAANEWTGMPEFVQEDRECYQTIIVRFASKKDVHKFAKRLKRNITPRTKYLWIGKPPVKGHATVEERKYIDES